MKTREKSIDRKDVKAGAKSLKVSNYPVTADDLAKLKPSTVAAIIEHGTSYLYSRLPISNIEPDAEGVLAFDMAEYEHGGGSTSIAKLQKLMLEAVLADDNELVKEYGTRIKAKQDENAEKKAAKKG